MGCRLPALSRLRGRRFQHLGQRSAARLLVAQTMQNFGATSVLAALYVRAEWTGDHSIEQITAEVSTAVDAASAV